MGYIGRAISHFNPTSLNPFIIQSLLLLLAPALFAASIYMLLGRLMRFLQAERHSLIRVNWITKLFVCGDVLSFTIQGAGISYYCRVLTAGGGIMAGGTLSMLHLGQTVIVVGLFTQLLFFGIFLAAAIVFHSRILKQPTSKSLQVVGRWWLRWNAVLYSLYVASILILVRSVFRIIEYLNGNDGFIQRHEAFLYVFDGVLMLSVMIIFNIIHPGKIINTRTAPQATWLEMGHGPDSSLESTKDERLSSHVAS